MKNHLKILLVAVIFASCNNHMQEKEAIFKADMKTPMGANSLRIYKDKTFQFEHRRLGKTTLYEGDASLANDTLHFSYTGAKPDFGEIAVIDGIFITYVDGVYRELLEISLNQLTE